MILIAGVTGRIGGSCARILQDEGVSFRAMGRGAEAPEWLGAEYAEWVQADMAEPASLASAFEGINKALLVAPNTRQQVSLERAFAEAASDAGVDLLVKVSSSEVSPEVTAPFPKAHYTSEQTIKELGLPACMLRPDYFMQNMLISAAGIKAAGIFKLPFGETRIGFIDARDVGEAAARILSGTGHAGKLYSLSGPDQMTFEQVATCMGEVLGREVTYVDQSPEDFRAFLASVIPDDWHVDAVCDLFAEIRRNPIHGSVDTLAALLGHAPRSLVDFTRDHRGAFVS